MRAGAGAGGVASPRVAHATRPVLKPAVEETVAARASGRHRWPVTRRIGLAGPSWALHCERCEGVVTSHFWIGRACVMCVERAVSSPCVSRVCARVPSRVLTVRESSIKGLEGVQSSGPGASIVYRLSHITFGGVRRAPSPLRRLRTSNNYNMQLVGRRRTRYAGVLGHLCSDDANERYCYCMAPRLQNSPDYKYIESCSWLPAGGGGSSGCRHRPQAPPAYMCMHMSYQA